MAEQSALEGAIDIGILEDLSETYWTLLLLADPDRGMVDRYVTSGTCFGLSKDGHIAGAAIASTCNAH